MICTRKLYFLFSVLVILLVVLMYSACHTEQRSTEEEITRENNIDVVRMDIEVFFSDLGQRPPENCKNLGVVDASQVKLIPVYNFSESKLTKSMNSRSISMVLARLLAKVSALGGNTVFLTKVTRFPMFSVFSDDGPGNISIADWAMGIAYLCENSGGTRYQEQTSQENQSE